MPYKSRAQQRLFHHLVSQGKLAPEVAEEYDAASKGKKIPQYVKRKAFGGQVHAQKGVHCPACDYPLDQAPVAMDAGEGCPRCGYGSAKDVPHKAHGGVIHHGMPKSHSGHGGEVMDSTAYRARGGVTQPHGGGGGMERASLAVGHGGRIAGYADGGEVPRRGTPEWNREVDAIMKDWRASHDRMSRRLADITARRPVEKPGFGDVKASEAKDDRVGFGDVKAADRYAHGGVVSCVKCGHEDKMARGGPVTHCARCGAPSSMRAMGGEVAEPLAGDLKELYTRKSDRGADLDDGKMRSFGRFAKALKHHRRK